MISDCADFLEFAASNLICISEGNHETKIVKTIDRDMIADLTVSPDKGTVTDEALASLMNG